MLNLKVEWFPKRLRAMNSDRVKLFSMLSKINKLFPRRTASEPKRNVLLLRANFATLLSSIFGDA